MKLINYFTKFEKALWLISVLVIIISFCIFDRNNFLYLFASLIGVTSIILSAKGNLIGQFLIIVFSILYGIISYSFSYYGEMITYLAMTTPMAMLALISWFKNPFDGNRTRVKVNKITKKEIVLMIVLTIAITIAFYFILSKLGTSNIIPSTISVTTSFVAVFLTFKRSPYFSIAYASNDIVLIVLWAMASMEDKSYISVLICFVVFVVNDLYGFINWKRMEKEQESKS